MLKFLIPKEIKVNIEIDDIKPRSNLTTIKSIKLTEKIFFYRE